MLPVSLDCPFLIAQSGFFKVYLQYFLYILDENKFTRNKLCKYKVTMEQAY